MEPTRIPQLSAEPTGRRREKVGQRSAEFVRSIHRMATIAWCVTRMMAAVVYQVAVHRVRPTDALARQLAPTLSRLGTTSIKLGQLIASSPGTFPSALVQACSGLRDNVGSDPDFTIADYLEVELGDGFQRFDHVEATPIAAASIAQVHVGRLDNGCAVAIKVQRPDIAGTLVTDLRLLNSMARMASRVLPSLRRIDITGLMASLSDQLMSELDFTVELDNAQILRRSLGGTGIRTPRCFAELCTSRVLVMEYLEGQALSTSTTHVRSEGSGPAVARRVLQALLAPLVAHGVFHADMHAGNLLVGPDGELGMVDFGCVSQLDEATREGLSHALLALFERRFPEAACGLLSLMDVSHADLDAARNQLIAVTSEYLDRSIEDMPVGLVIRQLIGIGTGHGIVMPTALLSLMRQMLFLDGITRELDPTFNFLDEGAVALRDAMGAAPRADSPSDAPTGSSVEPNAYAVAA